MGWGRGVSGIRIVGSVGVRIRMGRLLLGVIVVPKLRFVEEVRLLVLGMGI